MILMIENMSDCNDKIEVLSLRVKNKFEYYNMSFWDIEAFLAEE